MKPSKSFEPDDPWPDTDFFNGLLAKATRGRVLSTGPGIERTRGGLARQRSPWIWAEISGSSPAYGFAEATPNASGGFDLVAGGRTDDSARTPAYEANATTGLAGTYQRLRWSAAGDWRFREIRAGGGTGGTGGTTKISNCVCPTIPTMLTMTSFDTNCNFGMFQNCTIQYGPTPAGYAPLTIGYNSFLSVESFPDFIGGGAMFQYLFTCYNNQFNLSRVYLESPFGSPYHDGLLYTWVLNGYLNYCNPFQLDYGVPYPGSDPSCFVTING